VICADAAKLYLGAVARRIEIELTSARPDGTWTWRAAGALNPRGALEAALLYGGAKVGDVVRAEADFGMEGITVVSLEPPRAPEESDPNVIQLLDRPPIAAVTTQLAGRSRPNFDRDNQRSPGGSPPRRGGQGGAVRSPGAPNSGNGRAPNGSPGTSRPTGGRGPGDTPRTGTNAGPGATGGGVDRRDAIGRSARPTRAQGGPGRSGPGRPSVRGASPSKHDSGRPGTSVAGDGQDSGAPPRHGSAALGQSSRQAGGPSRPTSAQRQRRLAPGNANRDAMLQSLPAEEQPIAQQLLRGGIPAVRTALHFERERAREEGRPEPSTEGILAIADKLLSRVKAAEWRDRAEAAAKAGNNLSMRDLRSLLSGSDLARDDASRELVVALREALERRVEAHRAQWAAEVLRHLDDGHIVRALRLSNRPPDPAARLSAEVASRLRDSAGAALSPSAPPDKWIAVLQAVIESPVRRSVKPEGLPPNPGPELLEVARQQCGRVPALAHLLGIGVPPPPGPPHPNAARLPTRHLTRPTKLAGPVEPATTTELLAAPPLNPSDVAPVARSEPSSDAPVADAPVADAPVADAPVADAPVADAPVADAPPSPTASSQSAEDDPTITTTA